MCDGVRVCIEYIQIYLWMLVLGLTPCELPIVKIIVKFLHGLLQHTEETSTHQKFIVLYLTLKKF